MSTPRCHQRARPIEWRIPGRPTCPGRVTESCFRPQRVVGTSFWNRNQSLHGVPCRVQYSRAWAVMIWTPDRMMNVIRNRLKKCCQPTQAGMPSSRFSGSTVPAYRPMKDCTALHAAQLLGEGDSDDQEHEADRQQPQQV